jgi:hypothetical protein
MTSEDRTAIVRLIIDTMYREAQGNPDMLARRIVDELEVQGWKISPPGLIEPEPKVFDPGVEASSRKAGT